MTNKITSCIFTENVMIHKAYVLDNFTILLSSDQAEVAPLFKTLFPILEQTISIFITDVGKNDLIIPQLDNEALTYIDAVKKKMKREGVAFIKLKVNMRKPAETDYFL